MNKKLKSKIMESLKSVLPITGIVFLLSITIIPMPASTLMMFLGGALLLILGFGLFSLGVDLAMQPLGEGIGVEVTKMKKSWLALAVCFFIGIVITVAEPDLQVLATQVPTVENSVLIMTVAVGVGVFLAIAMLRILFRIELAHMLIFFYVAVFALTYFAPNEFMPVAFDSGGVTTGPVTVPFIMTLGIGMAMLRSDKDSRDDSFGLVALCSIGPVLSVLILSIIFDLSTTDHTMKMIPEVFTTRDIMQQFIAGLPTYAEEVLIALFPILALFVLFQMITKRFHGQNLIRLMVGMVYSYLGLVTFLTGVNVGFMPIGNYIGNAIATSPYQAALVPIGALIGFFIVIAEPAVRVLTRQVEEISNGAISQNALLRALSIGVACSVGIAMIRVLYGVPIIYFLIPGYLVALILTFFVPKMYTAIAFDSGGVASGPMTATFLLPLAMGACEGVGGNLFLDAFGIVAMVAMTPLITIQVMGFIYKKRAVAEKERKRERLDALADTIIFYDLDLDGEWN